MDLDAAKTQLGKMMGEEFTLYVGFLEELIDHLALNLSSKILDIGTGWGVMPLILALKGYKVLTGEPERTPEPYREHKDHQPHQTDGGKFSLDWRESARAVDVQHQIKFQHFDAEQLPFADGSFDGVFMNGTLHHLQQKQVALNETLRVITLHGVVTIIEGNKDAVEIVNQTHGTVYALDDPRDFLQRDDISVEVITGDLAQAYILRRTP
ncbi:MAG: class I SAM-dependent methyltransferase [Candidatus Ranarchaeia archaeon]|jgi:ubiquinone/menaquinone biosynthesis C-methylase UbiE